MVSSLTWRSVISSSVSSETLSERKGLSCSPLLMGIFWCFCKSKQVWTNISNTSGTLILMIPAFNKDCMI